MSWYYLPELVEGCLEADYSDGRQSVTLKGNHSALKCLKPGSGTASSTMPPFGMMSVHSTADPGRVASTLSRLGFLASPSQTREKERRVMIPATCGRTPFASLKRSGRRSLCWKTSQASDSGRQLTSGKSSVIWPRAGMMLDGTAYRLPSLEHPTNGRGCGLLPTPAVLGLLQLPGIYPEKRNLGKLRTLGKPVNWNGIRFDRPDEAFRKGALPPGLTGVDDGLAHRVDRLRAIGNGQVPAVVKFIWEQFTESDEG